MRHFPDAELRGHALLFDGPLDMIERARKANQGKYAFFSGDGTAKYQFKDNFADWPGRRQAKDWDDLVRYLHTPWPEAVKNIKGIVDGVKDLKLPAPQSVKRRGRWTDVDGDVDAVRAIQGEPLVFRESHRRRVHSPTKISLLCNLTDALHCNATGVFYRSSAAIAAADILEAQGYSVEIWIWNRSRDVFPEPMPDRFSAICGKRMGEPVDYDSLCDTLSAWFMFALTGSAAACPTKPIHCGKVYHSSDEELDAHKCGIGGWKKYVEMDETVTAIAVPTIRAWDVEEGLQKAGKVVKRVLEYVIRREGIDRVGD